MTEHAYKILAVMLKEQNIQFQILIFDVEKMMDDETAVRTRGMSFSFYSRYHPFDEVIRPLLTLFHHIKILVIVWQLFKSQYLTLTL